MKINQKYTMLNKMMFENLQKIRLQKILMTTLNNKFANINIKTRVSKVSFIKVFYIKTIL